MATSSLKPLLFSTAIIRPESGPEQWHNSTERIGYPNEAQPVNQENSLDVYYRFAWTQIDDGANEPNYDWGYFDGLVRSAIDNGQRLSFGIMTYNADRGENEYPDGSSANYPLWLHRQMQNESDNNKDWQKNGIWMPNWNSENYIEGLRALHQEMRDHLLETSYTPNDGPNAGKEVLFADAIQFIDIRGFGSWGEWHVSGVCTWSTFPAGRQPTINALKAIIDTHTEVFDKWPLVIMVAAYDSGASFIDAFHPYPEVGHYAHYARNAWGQVGFRKDQWSADDQYLSSVLENNPYTFDGSPTFGELARNKYKTGPITGEPPGWNTGNFYDLVRQVELYHGTSIGNGNYGGYPSALESRENIRAGFALLGSKIQISGGSFSFTNTSASVTLNWKNGGVCPVYMNWDVELRLYSESGQVEYAKKSSHEVKFFLPTTTPVAVTDSLAFSLPQGAYKLAVVITDPTGYRQPMPLYNEDRQSDGSYIIGTINITDTVPNQPPTANAGPNQDTEEDTVTLTGAGTDGDGTITSYQWTKITTLAATITSPDTAITTVTGLVPGLHTFQLKVTDNRGATALDTVNITVAEEAEGEPPVANAGSDREITLPISRVIIAGAATGSDGIITPLWSIVSGSGSITNPNSYLTMVQDLTEGTTVVRLTVTDNSGASASDEMYIVVKAPTSDVTVTSVTALVRLSNGVTITKPVHP
jgi:hypothetical protein